MQVRRTPMGALAALASGPLLLLLWAGSATAAPPAASTTTTVTLSATTAHPFQPVVATATVTPTPSTAAVAGTVTFSAGRVRLCSAVPVTAGAATCTIAPTSATSGTPVTAAYTPTDTATLASTGTGPAVTVSPWSVTVRADYSDIPTSTCSLETVVVTVVRPPAAKAINALPVPTGTVTVRQLPRTLAVVALPASGTVTTCVNSSGAASTTTYSGDANYRTGAAILPAHTRTGVAGGEGPPPAGDGNGGLAATGTSHIGALLCTGLALLLAGAGGVVAGRRRPHPTA